MYDVMLSAPFLRHIQKRITHSRAYYQQRSTGQSLDEEYQHLQNMLGNYTEERFTHLIEDVENARRILKSDAFYDINKLE